MACNCTILAAYTIGVKPVVIIPPFEITSGGIINGREYYEWTDTWSGDDFRIFWNPVLNRWELWQLSDPEKFLAYSETTGPCPGINTLGETEDWNNVDEGVAIGLSFAVLVEDCIVPDTEAQEEQDCFDILVWNKQCEFAQCVLKYLQKLQFGNVPCSALESLKNKKRALEILNCYDPRDINNNTTDYNTVTYSEIKTLLNN